mmetsp:Transcript_44775/g.136645  ORF Transcript_44775/g.136645 Transcript_44775/m.136645 type:complete len:202 (+) Transcript_44775:4717-5322(+)
MSLLSAVPLPEVGQSNLRSSSMLDPPLINAGRLYLSISLLIRISTDRLRRSVRSLRPRTVRTTENGSRGSSDSWAFRPLECDSSSSLEFIFSSFPSSHCPVNSSLFVRATYFGRRFFALTTITSFGSRGGGFGFSASFAARPIGGASTRSMTRDWSFDNFSTGFRRGRSGTSRRGVKNEVASIAAAPSSTRGVSSPAGETS